MTWARRVLSMLTLLALGACKQSPSDAAATSAPPAGSAARKAELVKKFAAMTPAGRLEAAKTACYVGDACDDAVTDAIFEAGTDAERAAFSTVARPAFAKQYKAALESQNKKPDSVSAADKDDATLLVTGELCNGFFVKNFIGGELGAKAKKVGFTHFECKSRAVTAKAEL